MKSIRFHHIILFFTCVLIGAQTTKAESYVGTHFSLSDSERQAANKIRDLLAKYVFVLDREMITFHYQRAESPTDFRPTDANQLTQIADEWGRGFFEVNYTGGDAVGPGHYVATDTISSRVFGGLIDPQLYVVPIKAGAKILNLTQTLGAKEQAFVEMNQIFNCGLALSKDPNLTIKESPIPSGQSIYEWFGFFRNSPNESC